MLNIQYSILNWKHKEKERLTKLFNLYEETEAECKNLKVENKGWQDWFNANKEIFNKIFSNSPPISKASEQEKQVKKVQTNSNNKKEEKINEKETEKENKTSKTKNKKRKLILRK